MTRYLAAHPDQAPGLFRLTEALGIECDLVDRRAFPLHVTCSAAVINAAGRVLMIHHRALNRWLLPGGHAEPEDGSLCRAALRELEEEAGIPWRHAVSPPGRDIVPVDIDVHEIPANPAKGEPAHLHADFRYAFHATDTKVSLQREEVTAFAWRPKADLPTPRLVDAVGVL
ncbi:NUDIX hydrolase [Nonomuraea polychroma]|uniref:NUDIX hydrolase n=1 Tax=Nonomuraea polychroma TaxID=46176 RepID=UPI003D8B2C5C